MAGDVRPKLIRSSGLLFVLPAAFLGCAAATGPPSSGRLPEPPRRQEIVRSLAENYPFVWEPEVISLVRGVGTELTAALDVPAGSFHLYVLDKPVVNAFTSPLGDIFIFSGQLLELENTSELAGVVAHEMAHVRAGHFERLQRSRTLGVVPGLMAAILSRGDPRVIASALAVAESYQLHFTREMESEADRLSLQYLRKTVYDPRGLLGALETIERGERLNPVGLPEYLLTHPVTPARVAELESLLGVRPGEKSASAPDPEWERLRAILLASRRGADAARRRFLSRLGEDPEDHDLRGVMLLHQGAYTAAGRELRAARDADPGNWRYGADLGAALYHEGRFDEARKILAATAGTEGGKGNSYVHYYLGEIHRREGRRSESLRAYQLAVDASPPLSEAHYQLALRFAGDGRFGEADYHFGVADLLRGDFAGASRNLKRAAGRFGNDPVWRSRIEKQMRNLE